MIQFDITPPFDRLQFIPTGLIAKSKVGIIPPGRTYSVIEITFDSTDSNGKFLSINGIDFLATDILDANYKFYDNTFTTEQQADSLVGAISTSPFLKYVQAEKVFTTDWIVRITAQVALYDLTVTRNDAGYSITELPNITRFVALNLPTQRRAGVVVKLYDGPKFGEYPAFLPSILIGEKKLLWTIEDNLELSIADMLRAYTTRIAPNTPLTSDAGPCKSIVWEAYNTSVDSTGTGSRENREFIADGTFTVFQGFAPTFNYDWTTANNEQYWNYASAPVTILGSDELFNFYRSSPDWTSILFYNNGVQEIRVRVIDLDTLTEYFHSYGTVDTSNNLHLLTLRTDPSAIGLPDTVTNYQITIYADGTLISKPKTYRFLKERCDIETVPTALCYLNRQGGWSTKYFFNYYERGVEREFVTYNKFNFLNNRPTTAVGVGVNTAETVYSTTLYSDYDDDLTDLLDSPLVYKFEGGVLLPIVITDTTYDSNRDERSRYSITFVDSFTKPTHTV